MSFACSAGNTPTCVGKTDRVIPESVVTEKHPHVRGEDSNKNTFLMCSWETPPRAWGRRNEIKRSAPTGGNTPTCVGKTNYSDRNDNHLWKHPHVRGEDLFQAWLWQVIKETPPRAWGRLSTSSQRLEALRNTPTCVGKTLSE